MLFARQSRKVLPDMCFRNVEHPPYITRDSGVTRNPNTLVEHFELFDIGFVIHNEQGMAVACTPFDDQKAKSRFTVGRPCGEHGHSELASALSFWNSIAAINVTLEITGSVVMARTRDSLIIIATEVLACYGKQSNRKDDTHLLQWKIYLTMTGSLVSITGTPK